MMSKFVGGRYQQNYYTCIALCAMLQYEGVLNPGSEFLQKK